MLVKVFRESVNIQREKEKSIPPSYHVETPGSGLVVSILIGVLV